MIAGLGVGLGMAGLLLMKPELQKEVRYVSDEIADFSNLPFSNLFYFSSCAWR